LLMHLFSLTSAIIAISHTSLRTRFSGLHLCRTQYGSILLLLLLLLLFERED